MWACSGVGVECEGSESLYLQGLDREGVSEGLAPAVYRLRLLEVTSIVFIFLVVYPKVSFHASRI